MHYQKCCHAHACRQMQSGVEGREKGLVLISDWVTDTLASQACTLVIPDNARQQRDVDLYLQHELTRAAAICCAMLSNGAGPR